MVEFYAVIRGWGCTYGSPHRSDASTLTARQGDAPGICTSGLAFELAVRRRVQPACETAARGTGTRARSTVLSSPVKLLG